ncbi:MAG TPA: fumarylacetoacetate hydrolase family protein [Acetobacteraceae bacterium]|nr:fumarylacetoacetate hydrolase family protein [Acetobacteraceae bacterium]
MASFDAPTAIESFWAARARGEWFPAAWQNKLSTAQAYEVLFGLMARRLAAGERQIGWKVGLTSKAIQQQFNVHEPVFGCILESQPSGHVFASGDLISPGFENELCLRLGKDLSGSITPDDARAAIDVAYPSLEIIETRGNLTEQLALALADNAQQKTVILGSPVKLPAQLEAVEARVIINGEVVATGTGDAVLGNPLNSVVWLAAKLGEFGRSLKAGEIIMSGSFTRQFPIRPGDSIRCEFSGIGAVETSMTTA